MVAMVSKYSVNISIDIVIHPDKNSAVSTTMVCIDEKYIDHQKIDAIKNEARIAIQNQIFDAVVKSEAEIHLRKLFHDDKGTMPVSRELIEWFLSNSEEILKQLEVAKGDIV